MFTYYNIFITSNYKLENIDESKICQNTYKYNVMEVDFELRKSKMWKLLRIRIKFTKFTANKWRNCNITKVGNKTIYIRAPTVLKIIELKYNPTVALYRTENVSINMWITQNVFIQDNLHWLKRVYIVPVYGTEGEVERW